MPPAISTTNGMGKLPKPLLQPDPWMQPYPHPLQGTSNEGTWHLSSLPSAANKATPKFFVWPLNTLYLIKEGQEPWSVTVHSLNLFCSLIMLKHTYQQFSYRHIQFL